MNSETQSSSDPLHGNKASELMRAAIDPTTHVPTDDPRAWQPPTPEDLQARLGDAYQVEAFLARGGMGAVYRGIQTSLERRVAIKILPPQLRDIDPSFAQRFKQEARAMAQLNHPSIVSVYDFGEMEDGTLYFIMEFIDGTDVAQMVSRKGRLSSASAMAITAHVCDALQYAHERGIVHRDIKPANIMVGNDGCVKVSDFGLAKSSRVANTSLTMSGHVMGTPHFLAPEALILGSSVDHRADIYAVGVMLYQMLTGSLPQGIFKMPSLLVNGLDPRYDQIIANAMREDRGVRYQAILEMRQALDAILTQPVTKSQAATQQPAAAAPQVGSASKATQQSHRLRQARTTPPPVQSKSNTTSYLLVAALVLILGGIGWMTGGKRRAVDDDAGPIESRDKTADEASAKQWLASPQQVRDFGGWTVVGNPKLSMENGLLTIESTGERAGIVSVFGDFTRHTVQSQLAASSDIKAWVGVRVAEVGGKWKGYTSSITGQDGMVLAGSGGCQFAPNAEGDLEGGMGKSKMEPGQFFTLNHEINSKNALWTKVDGKSTSGVERGVPAQGHIGLFVSGGKLTVKAMTIISREAPAAAVAIPIIKQEAPAAAVASSPRLRVEEGFVPLLDIDHHTGWNYKGASTAQVSGDGVTLSDGLYWYEERVLSDFVLRLDFRVAAEDVNGGIFIRVPEVGGYPSSGSGYEIDIHGSKTGALSWIKGSVDRTPPMKLGEWNSMEITAKGQEISVTLNEVLINKHVGDRKPSGYIALQGYRGSTQYRNVRIQELPSTTVTAPMSVAAVTEAPVARPDVRIFTDTQGREMLATLIRVQNDNVTLKHESGQEFTVKASTLSAVDIAYLKTKGLVLSQANVLSTALTPVIQPAVESSDERGFKYLLSPDQASNWKQCGLGGMKIEDGVGTTWSPTIDRFYYGVAWFAGVKFSDFVLKGEYRGVNANFNSGIHLRFPRPGDRPKEIIDQGYEVSILSPSAHVGEADMLVGAISHIQAPTSPASVKGAGEWNEVEVTVVGQKYVVKINGQVVNEFTGNRGRSGYIGIQNHRFGAVEWRNLRIKELSALDQQASRSQPTVAELRTFTGSNGKIIRASLRALRGDEVTLKLENGGLTTFKASLLSAADIAYLKTKGLVMPTTPTVPVSVPPTSTKPTAKTIETPTPDSTSSRRSSTTYGGMEFSPNWLPKTLTAKRELLESLDFYCRAAVGNAPVGSEPIPGAIVGGIRWRMPIDEAVQTLPQGVTKLIERPMVHSCLPTDSLILCGFLYKSFIDRSQPFNQLFMLIDKERKVVSVQFVNQTGTDAKWLPVPDGVREPYFNLLSLSHNGSTGKEVPYQILTGGGIAVCIKTAFQDRTTMRMPTMPNLPPNMINPQANMQGMPVPSVSRIYESVHWYVPAPFARSILDIVEVYRKAGVIK